MKTLKNRVIRIESRVAAVQAGESLESQLAALEAGRFGYTGMMSLVVACKADGVEEATERLPEPMQSYIREALTETSL